MSRTLLHTGLLFSLAVIFYGCGSAVQGKVEERFTKEPLQKVKVVAFMKTNIAEDKKYERKEATTDTKGEFKISGLSPKYSYTIRAEADGYFSMGGSSAYVSPPDKGKTRILDKPLQLIKHQEIKGRVIDNISGEPLSGVTIEASCKKKINSAYDEYKQRIATTNTDGEFTLLPLLPSVKYDLDIYKQGYSSQSTQFSTQGDIARFADISLMQLPEDIGAYTMENGGYLPLKMSDAKYKILKAGDSQICSYIYFNSDEVNKSPVIEMSPTKKLAILIPDESVQNFYIYPLFLFKRVTTSYYGNPFSGYYEFKKYHNEKNVYLAAQKVSDDASRTANGAYYKMGNTFKEVLETNKSKNRLEQYCSHAAVGVLAHTMYTASGGSKKLMIIDIDKLKKGIYFFMVGENGYLYNLQ